MFGHRGSPGFPRFGENTRASFRKALQAGAAGFELDVRRCGDRNIVVIHDAVIDRTTTGSGRVRDLPYHRLSQFDAGDGDYVPHLLDVVQEFASRCVIHIELKEFDLAPEVTEIVQRYGLTSSVVLSAFDSDDNDNDSNSSWNELASVADRVAVALLVSQKKLKRIGTANLIDAARRFGARGIHPGNEAR